DTADRDSAGTTADWDGTQAGVLRGAALTSRRARVTAAGLHARGALAGPGQYVAHVDPLVGAALNAAVPGIPPPTSLGRRVMSSRSAPTWGTRPPLSPPPPPRAMPPSHPSSRTRAFRRGLR